MNSINIGFIGCGNMATAIINNLIDRNISSLNINEKDLNDNDFFKKTNIQNNMSLFVYDIDIKKTKEYIQTLKNNNINKSLKLSQSKSVQDLIKVCDYIILSVKPNNYEEILIKNKELFVKEKTVISIMAGVKVEKLASLIKSNIVRVMPNLASTIGNGVTAIVKNNLSKMVMNVVEYIFTSVGKTIYIDENKMDAVTAVSGSGPAYVFKFIDSVVDSAVKLGLTYNEALFLATNTFVGSSIMCMNIVPSSNQTIQDKINAVCSKGGTTIEAIKIFEEQNLSNMINEAMIAVYNKSKKISEEL